MKNYKTMFLGIAVILWGIACRTADLSIFILGDVEEFIGAFAPLIGMVVTIIGYIFCHSD